MSACASEACLRDLGTTQTRSRPRADTDTFEFEEEQNGEGKEEGPSAEGNFQAGSRRVSGSSSLIGFPDPGDVV